MSQFPRDQRCPNLWRTAFEFPAIDSHAHQLLKPENKNDMPLEGMISEATGDALLTDSTEMLACYRATHQLAELFGLPKTASWELVKAKRSELDYHELCKLCFQHSAAGIKTILIDDGLKFQPILHDVAWHNQFTVGQIPCKRIVRIDTVAEELLEKLIPRPLAETSEEMGWDFTTLFWDEVTKELTRLANRADVVGFKSVIYYCTKLGIAAHDVQQPRINNDSYPHLKDNQGNVRFDVKEYNDYLVHLGLGVAQATKTPVQFQIRVLNGPQTLTLASPSHLQPLIKQYPDVSFVLLHSSYPYTRDAGYLAYAHPNVYLDFGEIFPGVAGHGQRSVIRQLLEIAPTNKIMWSTDGHFWPELYYLGARQSRQALYAVLSEIVESGDLTEAQAINVLENILFHNANRLYGLNL